MANPLVVDLDGTLIKSDLLLETANDAVCGNPAKILSMLRWGLAGRATLKSRLAAVTAIDVTVLPYNEVLLAWLREQKSGGRRLVLATASHLHLAERVAQYLGLFDEVLGSDDTVNLKAQRKRDVLVARYGDKGFDYVGDAVADLPVWGAADKAYVVSSSASLIAQVRAVARVEQVFADSRAPFMKSLLRAMRPHQWMKNLLVFVPLLAAHWYGDVHHDVLALIAFVVFGMTASSVYLLNDLVDVADDRCHARKCKRPFAAGDLSLLIGWLVWPGLLLGAGVIAAAALPLKFVFALGAYFTLTVAYSFGLKRRSIVDVITLAALYTLRIVAGAAAVSVPLSFWLLSFSMFIFLSLAFIKRFSELQRARDKGSAGVVRGRGYTHQDLEMVSSMGVSSGYLSVLVLALYIQDSYTAVLYATPKIIWLACPLLLYWISRAWMLTHRGLMHDDPIVFAIKDKISWLVGACFLVVFGLARFVS